MPLSSHFQKENLEVSQSSNGMKLIEKQSFLFREEVFSFLTIHLLETKTGKDLLYISLLFGAKREAASPWPCPAPGHPAGCFAGAFGRP